MYRAIQVHSSGIENVFAIYMHMEDFRVLVLNLSYPSRKSNDGITR
jgi:hypothetical protein